MLKGQAFDVDIEFMGGTIIFIAISLLLFVEILLPLLAVNYNTVTSEEDIKGVVFANLVKSRMSERIGDGEGGIEYQKIGALREEGLGDIGLSSNYVMVEDLLTGRSFDFGGRREPAKHDVYATLTSPYRPVTTESGNVLEMGEEYIVHIYKTNVSGNNIMLDIYRDAFCSESPGSQGAGSFKAIDCADMPDGGLIDDGVEINLRGMISKVRDMEADEIAWVKADSSIEAGDLLITSMELGMTWECTDSAAPPYLCVRMAGDYSFPAGIHVEIGKGADLVIQEA
jgi:hypothetical protein